MPQKMGSIRPEETQDMCQEVELLELEREPVME